MPHTIRTIQNWDPLTTLKNPRGSGNTQHLLAKSPKLLSSMASAAASKKLLLADDVPWRASPSGAKPLPKIHHSSILKLLQNPSSTYALTVMRHPDPVGEGFAVEARLEAAGPECIVPGQATPVKLLGLKIVTIIPLIMQVWPIEVDLKFLEPVGRELKAIGKFMDSAVNLMNASFQDR